MKNIILLGSTGSVGRNVLNVAERYPDRFRIKAISSNANSDLLLEQAGKFRPEIVAIGDEGLCPGLKEKVPGGTKVLAGRESLEQLAGSEPADIVFIAISGTAALDPLIAALRAGRTVALASKEPVVSAGPIITATAKENSAAILPVDSEHSAIMQCLSGRRSEEVRTLYITGSGGPLGGRNKDEFDALSMDEILAHPKWDMGRKITVDSATLMNKGLEVIEAHYLFNVPGRRIKVVIHPQAIIHSMVEFLDGTITASMFSPDMKFPILKALSYPEILESDFLRVDFSKVSDLTFAEPDTEKFPALQMAFKALEEGGTVPAALNSANETAVKLFLDGKIKFTGIVDAVEKTLAKHRKKDDPTLEEIIETEKWAAEEVLKFC